MKISDANPYRCDRVYFLKEDFTPSQNTHDFYSFVENGSNHAVNPLILYDLIFLCFCDTLNRKRTDKFGGCI